MDVRHHHVHIICSDLEEMIDFWIKSLDAKLVDRPRFRTGIGASLEVGGITINLRAAGEGEEISGDSSRKRFGYDHICFQVDDTKSAYEELTNRGISFSLPPTDAGTAIIAYFKGPDNITVELIQLLK